MQARRSATISFRIRRFSLWSAAALVVTAVACAGPISAQSLYTASKTIDVSAFGAYLHTTPDIAQGADTGVAFGVNITRYFHFPVAPSLEARVDLANGSFADERTYEFGVRGLGTFRRRFHPYGDFLIGVGTVHYNNPGSVGLLGDNGIPKSVGGGLDVDVARNFGIKVDYQQLFWYLGHHEDIHPTNLVVGVTYRVPFRMWNRQSDPLH
jgi:hypothetical protein